MLLSWVVIFHQQDLPLTVLKYLRVHGVAEVAVLVSSVVAERSLEVQISQLFPDGLSVSSYPTNNVSKDMDCIVVAYG